MRTLTLAILALPFAGPLAAQSRYRGDEPRPHAPVLQTATFDVAAAFQQHYRAEIEPLVFGRFAIGVSGEYTTEPDDNQIIYYPVGQPCPINMLCGTGTAGDNSGYRAWSFNLHARWYPALLSFGGRRQSASVYFGEFIGYHERRTSQTIYYGCPMCAIPQDTTIYYPPGGPSAFTQTVHGWEPGVEVGVRLLPMRHVVMDVGGRFRLATISDYQSRTQPGSLDSRLVVAVGVGW